MFWSRLIYNFAYRSGKPRWDTNAPPPEVRALIEGESPLKSGRALDLGCGTGTNVIYLAQHNWEAVGIDFSPVAIRQAQQKAASIAGATFIEGDVAKLSSAGINGPFDFMLDIGCFHGLPANRRQAYVQEIARVARPGAIFMIWTIAGRMTKIPGAPSMQINEIVDRFSQEFTIEAVEHGEFRWPTNWHILRRK